MKLKERRFVIAEAFNEVEAAYLKYEERRIAASAIYDELDQARREYEATKQKWFKVTRDSGPGGIPKEEPSMQPYRPTYGEQVHPRP